MQHLVTGGGGYLINSKHFGQIFLEEKVKWDIFLGFLIPRIPNTSDNKGLNDKKSLIFHPFQKLATFHSIYTIFMLKPAFHTHTIHF